jgi:hypothetical protein
MNPGSGKLLKDPVKAIVLWYGGLSGFGIAAPEDCDFVGIRAQAASLHATLLAWRVAQSLDGRLTGHLPCPEGGIFTTSDDRRQAWTFLVPSQFEIFRPSR